MFQCSFDNQRRSNNSPEKPESEPNASILIRPYNEADRGRFWEVCISNVVRGSQNAWMEYTVNYTNGQNYIVETAYDWRSCDEFNVLVHLTHRHTPHEDWKKLKEADATDIDSVRLVIKKKFDSKESLMDIWIKPDIYQN